MSVEWAAWVQAVTAIVLAAVTVWYVYLTHRLLQAQVEPSVDLWIPRDRVGASIQNTGTHSVVDVRVDVELALYEDGRRVGGAIPPPWQPGADRCNTWSRLRPGEVRNIDLTLDAANAVSMAGLSGNKKDPGVSRKELRAVLLLHVVYYRAVDHRRFRFTRAALLAFDSKTDKVHHLIDEDAFRYPTVAEERQRAS